MSRVIKLSSQAAMWSMKLMPLPCGSGPCHFPATCRGAGADSRISLRGGEHQTPSGTDNNVFWDSAWGENSCKTLHVHKLYFISELTKHLHP